MRIWQDDGLILHVAPLGETKLIASVLTAGGGRWRGCLKRPSKGKAQTAVGLLGHIEWQARLEDQLGTFQNFELIEDFVSPLLFDSLSLRLFSLMCDLLQETLPERQAYPLLYHHTIHLLKKWQEGASIQDYVTWELMVLRELGFGLDLSECVVTKEMSDLLWVSPKTGKAVSSSAARGYENRLLPLPSFLKDDSLPEESQIIQALELTGYFLGKSFGDFFFYKTWSEKRGALMRMLGHEKFNHAS